ncbi:hypothetical protein JKF63_05886 [Porcisia hertigi]|uniref:DUF1736 domain-containing protein n=1 Tax=Porcisia hertigi TaxID=2761500 RepID=A0A836IX47_9TRYP|nr:hypothetical protein JKF63_05886 [Porcisia hertigi]
MPGPTKEKVPVTKPLTWRLIYPVDAQIHSFLLLVAAVIFSNGIRGDMTFDDHLAIDKNADSWADKTSLSSIFFNDFWGKSLDRLESNRSYRPITVLTFRVQHWLMGYRHSPVFLHSVNYVLAYLNVCLVFYLARLYVYVAAPRSTFAVENAQSRAFTALLTSPLHAVPLMAALLFLVHPVHVDAVTSIVGRCELLYCLFGLIGFFCIHRYLNQVDGRTSEVSVAAGVPGASRKEQTFSTTVAASRSACRDRKRPLHQKKRTCSVRYVVLSACALTISILCKDSAITFTALYSAHACLMYVCQRCHGRHSLLVIGVAVLELFSYLVFRRRFIGNVDLEKNPLLRQTENPQYFVPKGIFHWFSIRWVIQVKNAELLFFPTSLCCEYSFNCIPHLYDMQDPRVPYFIIVTCAALTTVLGCIYGTFASRSRAALVGLVGILWAAIPYAPVSHLFVAVGTFVAERCLYVPSIGAVLLITFIVATPGLRVGVVPRYFYALLLLLCVGWGIFSHRRNEDWLTDERLFRSAVRACPSSGKAHGQLAALVSGREKRVTPEVVELAQRSIELDPKLRDAYFYLAANEVNTHHNMEKAYRYLRLCMEDPFAVNTCQASYDVVRKSLFPNMTEVDVLLDYASLTVLKSQKAVYLRHAGLIALRSDNDSCLAQKFFDEALSDWNDSKLYWLSDEVNRETSDFTYCNALYWYELSSLQCEAQNMAGTVESLHVEPRKPDDRNDVDSSSHTASTQGSPLTPQEAARRAVALAERFRPCGTNWHRIFSEPKYNLPTIPHRMTQYLVIADHTREVLNHYASYTESGTPERSEVMIGVLDILVRQFCHAHTLTSDKDVRRNIGGTSQEYLASIDFKFKTFRPVQISDMRTALSELQKATSLNATQQDTMKNVVAMASCSSDLSFLTI